MHGIDTESIRIMLNHTIAESAAAHFSTCKVKVPEINCEIVIVDSKIVTINDLKPS